VPSLDSTLSSLESTTMSSPNHIMSSFSQAGSSTTHTMTNYLRSFCTSINLHNYLCRVTGTSKQFVPRQTSSIIDHGRSCIRSHLNPPIYNGLLVVVIILLHSVLWVTYDHSRISIMDIVQYHTPHSILAAHPDVLFGFTCFLFPLLVTSLICAKLL
jgi:hypothetical protein